MNIPPSKPSQSQPIASLASARSRQAAPSKPEPSAPARVQAQEGQDPRGRLESFNQHVQDRLSNFIEVQGLNPEQAAIVKEAAAEFGALVERLSGAFDRGAQGTEHLAQGFRGMMQNLRADVHGSRHTDHPHKAMDTQRMEPGKPMPERVKGAMPAERMEPGKPMPERVKGAMHAERMESTKPMHEPMGADAPEVTMQERLANVQSMIGDRISNGLAQSGLSEHQMQMLESAQESFDALLERMSGAIEQRGGLQQKTMSNGFNFIMNSLRNDVQTMLQAVPKGLDKLA